MKLSQTEFLAGEWKGRLEVTVPGLKPQISVFRPDGKPLESVGMTVAAGAVDCWDVTVRLPEDALSEGTHVYLIKDTERDEVLHRITIIAGTPATDDLRAEIAALRAELDQLRAAFRTAFRAKGSR